MNIFPFPSCTTDACHSSKHPVFAVTYKSKKKEFKSELLYLHEDFFFFWSPLTLQPLQTFLMFHWPKHANLNIQFSSVAQSCPTLCDSMNCSTPGLPVHHQLPEFTQTHVHWVSDAIQPSHPLSSPSPPAPIPPSIRVFSNESTLRMRSAKY